MIHKTFLKACAICVCVTLSVSAVGVNSARANTLDDSIATMSEKLASYLTSKGEHQISVGQFIAPPQLVATSGPSISKRFHSHLEKHDIQISRRAKYGLQGKYALSGPSQDKFGVVIECSLVDGSGQVLTDFTVEGVMVDHHPDVVELVGATTHIFHDDLPADQIKDIKKSIEHPSIHVKGARCHATSKSPFGIEVVVHGKPIPIAIDDGLGFVHLDRGDVYRVRLFNDSDHEAAAKLLIDGLSVFTFSDVRNPKTHEPKYKHYIIAPHSFIELAGWHRTNSHVDSFLVTGYADSAAATIQHTHDVGTITAVFAAAWPKNGTPPSDEHTVGRGGNATGFGPPVKQNSKEVERTIGKFRAAVSLRYEK